MNIKVIEFQVQKYCERVLIPAVLDCGMWDVSSPHYDTVTESIAAFEYFKRYVQSKGFSVHNCELIKTNEGKHLFKMTVRCSLTVRRIERNAKIRKAGNLAIKCLKFLCGFLMGQIFFRFLGLY